MARSTCGLMVAGDRPSFASDRQNFASGVPTAMSQAATRPVPPANAGPCTRAIGRLGHAVERGEHVRRAPCASARFSLVAVARHALHPVEVGAGAERRAVAREDHARELTWSFSMSGRTSVKDAISASSNALRTSGRSSVTRATPFLFSSCAAPHILKTPNFVSSIGALSEAEIARPSSRRVSAGSTTPSSQSRALA